MNGFNDDELAKKVSEARQSRGGKPAKYPLLKKYQVNILQLIKSDVQLPFILKWLVEDKNENLVLNTLRKYVVRAIGRAEYEEYLKRNGWMKNKKTAKAVVLTAETVVQETAKKPVLGFDLIIEKPANFKRTERE